MHARILVLLMALALAATLGMPHADDASAHRAADSPRTASHPAAADAVQDIAPSAGSSTTAQPPAGDESVGSADAPARKSRPIRKGPNCRKVRCMALTFDDGPGLPTPRLLKVLKRKRVKATFFLVGQMVDARPETARKIARHGHEIGVHSWSHVNLTTEEERWLNWQLVTTKRKIREVTGVKPTLSRPPYGATNPRVLRAHQRAGLAEVLWNIDTSDWKIRDARHVRQVTIDRAQRNGVVLMHDIRPTTVDAVELMIRQLRRRGYHLVTVSELIGDPVAGRSYFDWRKPNQVLSPLPRGRQNRSAH